MTPEGHPCGKLRVPGLAGAPQASNDCRPGRRAPGPTTTGSRVVAAFADR
ncbi:hypothetical protein [Luteimonas viscosa]|nr:hypothetical protein [Luteimonas viscosa]